jgi:serine/threonine-protein kinase
VSGDSAVREAPASGADEPVQVLGAYTLHGVIARGGMATVYFGRRRGGAGSGPIVAIKRLHPELAHDPEFVAMFVDEARLASQVLDPHVVTPIDIGVVDGELFVVFEYVGGASLARLLRQAERSGAPMPPAVASAVVCDMLRGLHAAHQAKSPTGELLGIVHRDVSPQNVLVARDGRARLIDFGVATARARLQHTRDQRVKGKLAYMAPEQLRGRAATAQSDVYASAAVLWEALAGRRLFRGDNEGAVVEQILVGLVDPPSKWATALPEAVDALVLRALSAVPADRFPSAASMADALALALPPAGGDEVAAWIESVDGPALASAADRVQRIGTSPEHGDGSPAIAAASAPSPHPPARQRSLLLAGLWAVGALAAAVAAALIASDNRAVPAAAQAATPPVASAAAAVEAPPAATVDEKAAEEATPVPASAPASTRAGSARRAAPSKVDCRIPFTLDAQGRRVYRRECL